MRASPEIRQEDQYPKILINIVKFTHDLSRFWRSASEKTALLSKRSSSVKG